MRLFLRSVLAVVVGLLAGFMIIAGGEAIGHHVSPPPSGMDPSKPESIAAMMGQMPVSAFVPILLSWGAGTFAGAWIAGRIASRRKLGHGMIVGGLFLAATLAILLMIPHPAWIWVVGLGEIVLVGYLGARLASPSMTKVAGLEP